MADALVAAITGADDEEEEGDTDIAKEVVDKSWQDFVKSFCSFITGLTMLHGAWFLLARNERNYVCTGSNIMHAEDVAVEVPCNASSQYEGSAVFFSCPLEQASMRTFTMGSFNDNMSSATGSGLSFPSTAGMQRSWMWQCVERRQKMGEKTTVYSYWTEWRPQHVDSSQFSKAPQALVARKAGCPDFELRFGNPKWPENLRLGRRIERANRVRAGSFEVQESLMEGFHPDTHRPVPLADFADNFAPLDGLPPMPAGGIRRINRRNTAVNSLKDTLDTCGSSNRTYGCLRIRYYASNASVASVVTKVGPGGVTVPIPTPATWGCGEDSWEALLEGSMSRQDIFASVHQANSDRTWAVRCAGIAAACSAVFLILSPIYTILVFLAERLFCFTACGKDITEAAKEVLDDVVDAVFVVASVLIGGSTSLLVIGVVWVAMRPAVGISLFVASAILGLTCCVVVRRRRRREEQEESESNEDVESELSDLKKQVRLS